MEGENHFGEKHLSKDTHLDRASRVIGELEEIAAEAGHTLLKLTGAEDQQPEQNEEAN